MDDYITGVEQVGVDPTAAVETVAPVDTHEKVDPATDVYEFKEYDLKEYDNKEFVEKPYDYGDYGDYDPVDAKPTSAAYEEEFGPGVPAETDIRQSSVSAGVGGGGGMEVNGQECEKMEKMPVASCLVSCLRCPFCLLFLMVSGYSLEHFACTKHKYTSKHKHTPRLSKPPTDKQMSTQLSVQTRPPQPLGLSDLWCLSKTCPSVVIPPMICLDYPMTN